MRFVAPVEQTDPTASIVRYSVRSKESNGGSEQKRYMEWEMKYSPFHLEEVEYRMPRPF